MIKALYIINADCFLHFYLLFNFAHSSVFKAQKLKCLCGPVNQSFALWFPCLVVKSGFEARVFIFNKLLLSTCPSLQAERVN